MNGLAGKSTLVTGATSGIGLATARRFLEEGARVAISGREPARLAAARAELGRRGGHNRRRRRRCRRPAGHRPPSTRGFGKLDAVFANAGIVDLRPLAEWNEAAFDRMIAIDLKGPYFLVQALLPLLASPSSIILSGSVNAHMGMGNTHVYSLAKAGMISLARTLSGELIGRGIRANVVSPGPIDTPLNNNLGLGPEETAARAKAIVSLVPAGRFGTAEEIANAVVFLASDECPFMVGGEIPVDGGMSIL